MLTIRAIQALPLVAPLRRVFRGSNYQMTKRCTVITRVLTAEGIVGESYNGDEEGDAQVRLVRTITDRLAPLLAGRDAALVESCWQAMLPITYDILGDRVLAMKAITARTRNRKNRIFAASNAMPSISPKPSRPAIRAITRNAMAMRSMGNPPS